MMGQNPKHPGFPRCASTAKGTMHFNFEAYYLKNVFLVCLNFGIFDLGFRILF